MDRQLKNKSHASSMRETMRNIDMEDDMSKSKLKMQRAIQMPQHTCTKRVMDGDINKLTRSHHGH